MPQAVQQHWKKTTLLLLAAMLLLVWLSADVSLQDMLAAQRRIGHALLWTTQRWSP